MKKLLLILMCFISTIAAYSQECVDIQISKRSNRSVIIDLLPQSNINNSIFSSLVFSISWNKNDNIVLGLPSSDIGSGISLSKSGGIIQNGNTMYQIFVGMGNQNIIVANGKITITIPVQGKGKLDIGNDTFINNLYRNGGYYVALNGQDRTGKIKTGNKILDSDVYAENTKVYPNPSNGSITIESTDIASSSVTIQIFDISGRSIFKKNESVSNKILMTNLDLNVNSGIYILVITDGVKSYKSRFVIED